jgi:hypothetical protein
MASTVVEVPMHYLKDLRLYDTEKPFAYETGPSYEDPTVSNISHELHPVSLENIRGRENEFNYDQHSFAFVRHQSVIDFSQPNQDSLGYILENTQILKDQFNTDQVICYDLRVRQSSP